jgi:hypothetical protein
MNQKGVILMTKNIPKYLLDLFAIILLLLATKDMPYSYYTFLRLYICFFCLYECYHLYKISWTFYVYAIIAILFNPFIIVRLQKDMWINIDFVSAILLFILGIYEMIKNNKKR